MEESVFILESYLKTSTTYLLVSAWNSGTILLLLWTTAPTIVMNQRVELLAGL
jgi:hypothetical protein